MPELAPQRDCDGCTLCCKVMNIPELEKPAGTWCRHCVVGTGCGIHTSRPEVCRQFYCMYITNRNLGPEWKPSEARFVVSHDAGGQRISVYVDTQRPESWRREPYLSTFRAWSEIGARTGGQVVVFVARRAFVVVPDRIVDLGEVAPDELILTAVTKTAQGIRLEPFKAGKDDPRAQRFLASNPAR
jgi:hypothetical protein